MPDDLIDLPLGDDADEPTFPTDQPATGRAGAAVRGRPSKRKPGGRHAGRRPLPWIWLVVVGVVLAATTWLYWRPPTLELSPEQPAPVAAAVGDRSEPVEIEIRNPGRRRVVIEDIRVTGDAGFSIGRRQCGADLPSKESCRVQVEMVPARMGAATTRLEVVGSQRGGLSAISIEGEGLGARMVSAAAAIDFGSVPVDGRSSPRRIQITNQGTLPGPVGEVVIDSREFRVISNDCGRQLEPGTACGVEVVFQPRGLGARPATLDATGDVAEPLPGVRLTGTGTGPGFEIRPARLDFGEQKVGGTTAVREVEWINEGDDEWSVANPRLEGEGFRLISDTCGRGPIPVNGSCSARVSFAPTAAGGVEADLVLVHRDGGRFPPAELRGVGTAPDLDLDLRRISFAATPVGRTSPPRILRLTNTGSAVAERVRVDVEGPAAAAFQLQSECGSVLEVGATCPLRLQFAPQGSGDLVASLQVHSDQRDSPLTLPLLGNGASPRMALSRDRLDFATVPQGESQELQLAIENPGSAALEVTAIDIQGPGFAVRNDECSGRMVVAGGDCSLDVRFQPNAPGAFVGAVVVRSPVGTAEVSLSGLAGEPPVPRVSIDPRDLAFDLTPVGGRSPAQTITLTSHGPGRLTIRGMAIEGEGAAAYRLVPGTCADLDQLVPGSRCSVGVRFQPSSSGSHRAVVVVRGSGEPAVLRVDMRGETTP